MKTSFVLRAFVCVFTVVALCSCVEDENENKKDETIAVTGVSLDQSNFTLIVGENKTLVAVVIPDNATNKEISWSSSDINIATVSEGVVTAVAEGSAIITATTVDGEKTATCLVIVIEPAILIEATVEKLAAGCWQLFQNVYSTYLQIDSQYSTLEARQNIHPSYSFLSGFWHDSYVVVKYCHQLLERLELEENISDADRNSFKGNAIAYKAFLYFYLKTLFGGVPVITSSEYPDNEVRRASEQEMNDFISEALREANDLIPANDSILYMFAIVESQNSDTNTAYARVKETFDKMTTNNFLSFTDVNGDKIISANEYSANTMTIQIYLLYAEASLNAGKILEAIETINVLHKCMGQTLLSAEETADNIKTAIQNIFNNCNTGMKYLNLVRWGLTSDWGYRVLLPIPLAALGDNILQNEGW
jgi:hypothetical protein